MTVAERILEKYKRYGWSRPVGEWGFIQEESRRELRDVLEDGALTHLTVVLAKMFQCSVSAGLTSQRDYGMDGVEELKAGYQKAVEQHLIVWALYAWPDGDIASLAAPRVGEPDIATTKFGVDTTLDLPRHDRYARWISGLTPEGGTVLIIGGGYGGTVRQLLLCRPDVWVTMVDLPETLYLAWYWLDGCGLDVGWWEPRADTVAEWNAAEHARIELLPYQDLDDGWPDADVVFGAHCFSEMSETVVADYMRRIRESGAKYFAHSSAHQTPKTTTAESTCVLYPERKSNEMSPGPPYREIMRAPASMWLNTGERYWDFLFARDDA
jgi:hypothetical protein